MRRTASGPFYRARALAGHEVASTSVNDSTVGESAGIKMLLGERS